MADLIPAPLPILKSFFTGNGASFGVGDEVWCLDEPLMYSSKLTQRSYLIEGGFLHDYASVPRPLQPFVPKCDGIADRAYILHDWLVRNRVTLNINLVRCHELFYEAMRACGVPTSQARIVWGAVYAFNWMCAGDGLGQPPDSLIRRLNPIMLRPA